MIEFAEVLTNGRLYRVEFFKGEPQAISFYTYEEVKHVGKRYYSTLTSTLHLRLVWRKRTGKQPGKILKQIIAAGHAKRATGDTIKKG